MLFVNADMYPPVSM